MKRIIRLFALCLTLVIGTTAHAGFVTMPSDGALSGSPGSTLTWNYSITNDDSTNWLVLTALSANVFQYGTPTDIFDYPIIAPNGQSLGGLYQFTWDTTAPIGFSNSGQFTLSAELWDGDPLSGGSFTSLTNDMSAPYTTTVTANPVPAPPSVILLAAGLVGTGLARLVQRRRRQN